MTMNPTARRVLIWSVPAGALVLVLILLLRPRPLAVDLVDVQRGPLVVTLDETGETRVRDTFVVSAPVTGRIGRIEAEPGDAVRAGHTVFARIEPIEPALLDLRSRRQAEAAIAAAEDAETLAAADLERAEADAEFALAELERARRLRAENMIATRELDLANHDHRAARAALETARAALSMSRHELERVRAVLLAAAGETEVEAERKIAAEPEVAGETRYAANGSRGTDRTGDPVRAGGVAVRAPIDGTVLAVHRESAGLVAAGDPLVEIGDTRDLEIVVDLLSSDAVKVRPGQRVVIDGWGGEAALAGRVERVEPFATTKVSALGIEEQRANAIVELESPPDTRPGLGHGYQLEVRIVLWEGEDVLTVPLTALSRTGDAWTSYVEREGRAMRREVTIGRRTDLEAEIVTGLEAGERIVRHPGNRLSDAVRIVERRSLAAAS